MYVTLCGKAGCREFIWTETRNEDSVSHVVIYISPTCEP